MLKLRQDYHVWYILSCGCIVKRLIDRRYNTTICPTCFNPDSRAFILETVYSKPLQDD